MSILLYILGGLAALIAILNLVGLALPRTWSVARSIESGAPPAKLYPLVAGFRDGWSRWSPWGPASDPSMKMSYAGPLHGVGAQQAWTGGESGHGEITIVDAVEAQHVRYRLAFGAFTIEGTIELADASAGSRVEWTNRGVIAGIPMLRFGRFFAQRVVGSAMERGLGQLVAAT